MIEVRLLDSIAAFRDGNSFNAKDGHLVISDYYGKEIAVIASGFWISAKLSEKGNVDGQKKTN